VTTGPNEGYLIPQDKLEQLLDWYYEARGWDANGLPTKATLLRLDLGDVAEVLAAEGVLLN
jgi:aldehyde:ferredoxin oxidoreductase